MTFEESLDRLKERHEALIQSMELHAGIVREELDRILILVQEDGENIRALAQISEMPERRPSSLEGGEK